MGFDFLMEACCEPIWNKYQADFVRRRIYPGTGRALSLDMERPDGMGGVPALAGIGAALMDPITAAFNFGSKLIEACIVYMQTNPADVTAEERRLQLEFLKSILKWIEGLQPPKP